MNFKRVAIPMAVAVVLSAGAAGIQGGQVSVMPVASAQSADTVAQAGKLLPDEKNTVDIVKKYGPSVVAVNVVARGKRVNPLANVPPQLRPFFKQFEQQQPEQQRAPMERAAGSGFVIDKDGHILTNYHVVADALEKSTIKMRSGSKITVRFENSKKELPVKVIGTNRDYDLALLEVKSASDIPKTAVPIPVGDANHIQVGEKAIAIGNPFNLQSTVTVGIVSALQRKQPAMVSGVTIPFVQTDASINPGSSGSPLLDSGGRLIGINDEILAPNGTFVGVGFAIPSDIIAQALPALKKGGVQGVTDQIAHKARIGIRAMEASEYPKAVRDYLHMPENGIVVVQVAPGGSADKAGIEGPQFTISAEGHQWPAGGDVIVSADGKKLTSVRDLQKIVVEHKAGDHLELGVWRQDKVRKVQVTLTKVKSEEQDEEDQNQ